MPISTIYYTTALPAPPTPRPQNPRPLQPPFAQHCLKGPGAWPGSSANHFPNTRLPLQLTRSTNGCLLLYLSSRLPIPLKPIEMVIWCRRPMGDWGGGHHWLQPRRSAVWASVSVTLVPKSPRRRCQGAAVPAPTLVLRSNFPHPGSPDWRPPRSLRSSQAPSLRRLDSEEAPRGV